MYTTLLRTYNIIGIILITILLISIPAALATNHTEETLGGVVGTLRGGFGVKAPIDNYQLAWGNRPLNWALSIEGDFVLFGQSSGTVAAMGKGVARSPLFPPTIGFGSVTITLTVSSQGSILEQRSHNGYMIGPFILLDF